MAVHFPHMLSGYSFPLAELLQQHRPISGHCSFCRWMGYQRTLYHMGLQRSPTRGGTLYHMGLHRRPTRGGTLYHMGLQRSPTRGPCTTWVCKGVLPEDLVPHGSAKESYQRTLYHMGLQRSPTRGDHTTWVCKAVLGLADINFGAPPVSHL